ncbi:MAG: ectonucleotide pyrophosphatase/phosphodiesterase [Terricaulis sp.]
MTWLRSFVFALIVAAFSADALAAPAPPPPITILISIDGFRPDYLNRGQTPTLSRLAQQGVLASMRPSFPSVTFPNHYTLVTGLRPDHHGMINNTMEDPSKPGVVFTINNRAVASDPLWWNEATPIWVTAEKQGVHTGTMFWPGSEYEIHGSRPSRYRVFDQAMSSFARVDVLLSWLDLPADQRPRFFTLYFDIVDSAGHHFGPDSTETTAAAAEVDASISRLLTGLDRRGYRNRVNYVIVADHGMTNVSAERVIELDPGAPATAAHVVWDGPFAGLTPLPGHEADVEHALLGRHDHGECWRKGEIPERFHFGNNARVPAIICLADLGWQYHSTQTPQYSGTVGNHGFDPAEPDMAALFLAYGPAFKRGARLPSFDNVSIYPLVTHLIGVTPETNDGNLADTAAALR